MGVKDLRTTVTILGRDALSPVVATAATRSAATLKALNSRITRLNTLSAGAFGFAGTTGRIAAAITVPLGLAANEAIKFESEMASVGKVANLALGSSKLNVLAEQAKDVSEYLGEAATESARAFGALKQSGLAVNDLKAVAQFTGESAVAFDMMGKEAGTAFGNIRSALGYTVKDTMGAFDAINQLSNTMNATPSRLISFMTAGGAGVANALRLPAQDIAAFGATMIAAGKSGEEAATIMERVAKNTFSKKPLTNIFEKGGGGTKGLLAILKKGAALKTDRKQAAYFKQFGEYGLEVRRLATNMAGPNGLNSALGQVANTQKYAGAVQKEFNAKMQATEYQLKRLKASVMRVVIDTGTALLPVIKQIAADVLPVVKNIGAWIKANPELTASILKGAASLAIFTGGVSALSAVVGSVAKVGAWGLTLFKWGKWAATAATGMLAATGSASTLATAFGVLEGVLAVLVAPATLVTLAIAAVGYAGYKAYQHLEPFHKMIITLTTGLDAFMSKFQDVAQLAVQGKWFKIMGMAFDGTLGKKWQAVKTQTQLNVDAHMKDFRAERGLKNDKESYDQWASDKKAGTAQAFKPLKINQGFMMPAVRSTSELINTEKLNNAVPPKPLEFKGQGSSISVTNNPIFNINGTLTPDDKTELTNMLHQSNYSLNDMIRKAMDDRERKKHRLAF